MKTIFVFILFLFAQLTYSESLIAQNIIVHRRWKLDVPGSDIIDAGLDYPSRYTSDKGKVRIDITNKKWNERIGYQWSVDVRKSDFFWDDRIKIFARRTRDGQPYLYASLPHNINGGEVFQEVTDFDQYFFQGLRGFNDIRVQYKLEGVSVLIPAERYNTVIIYTITDS